MCASRRQAGCYDYLSYFRPRGAEDARMLPEAPADLVAAPPQGRERVGHRRLGDGEDDGSRGRVHPALLQPGPLPRRERQGAAAADSAGEDEGPGEVEPRGREGGSKKRKKDDMMAPRGSFGGGMPMGMGGMNMGGNQMGMGGMGMGGMNMSDMNGGMGGQMGLGPMCGMPGGMMQQQHLLLQQLAVSKLQRGPSCQPMVDGGNSSSHHVSIRRR
ncbi:hypothetical protein THAOC_08770 [Thalassiosira oceanica]|uniref:Uncharacterized protein n=1 Tax=Thalassiosira oceanica TaxID=159749 RepID=K0T925_THAOC|nr:hypothetical protein THAOC_08770 [Thalassiosira oceanica]|eukprot:EJK69926.1 hypothetical protein THAOC_08770 [Thalassiosira oceanica]